LFYYPSITFAPLSRQSRCVKLKRFLFHIIHQRRHLHARSRPKTDRFLETGQQAPAAGLTLNLASNNPFRNLSPSPVTGGIPTSGSKPVTPTSPFDDPIPPRPVSRNPFLDPLATKAPPPLQSPGAMSTQSDKGPEPTAEEIFVRVDLPLRVGFNPAACASVIRLVGVAQPTDHFLSAGLVDY
jgi:hypothetical protein